MWSGSDCRAFIDWKTAGVGRPGVDLGELRKQVALANGEDAPRYVLEGWERASDTRAADLAYWDAVAALNTPTDCDPRGAHLPSQRVPSRGAGKAVAVRIVQQVL